MIISLPSLRTEVSHVDVPEHEGDFSLRYSDAPENQSDPKPPTTNVEIEEEAKRGSFAGIFPKIEIPKPDPDYDFRTGKKRVKGIAEDAFRAMVDEARARANRSEVSTAADSKEQGVKHKKHNDIQKNVKSAQDHKMSQREALTATRQKLSTMGPRPTDPKKAQVWNKRRQALASKIRKQVEAMRGTDSKIATLRASK